MAETDGLATQFSGGCQKDRRKHPRFQLRHDVLLYNHETFAEIVDISVGGVACRCLSCPEGQMTVMDAVDLLNCEVGQYVKGLKCRLVRRNDMAPAEKGENCRMYAWFLEFTELSPIQIKELRHFIANCSQGNTSEMLIH